MTDRARPTRRDPQPRPRAPRAGRQRAQLSLDAVVAEAVAILDESGDSALTFRALAQRLGGGVGSIYWYVESRNELLDRAADRVLADVLAASETFANHDDDPIDNIRSIARALFDTVTARSWLAAYFMRDAGAQPNGLRLYERVGQQVLRLGLGSQESFYAVSAVFGYVIGVAADLGQEPPEEVLRTVTSRDAYLSAAADYWRSLDAAEYPFLHTIVDDFAGHDDADQFRAGLDILLVGLRHRAEESGG